MRLLLTAVAAILMAAAAVLPGIAQDITSVGLRAVGTDPDGPHGGDWWHFELRPGEAATGVVEIVNPADVPQDVEVRVMDLSFTDAGTPEIPEGQQRDVGAWSTVDPSQVTIPAGGTTRAEFTIQVPAGAEPGDHIGVLSATTMNPQGDFDVRRRIARRLYVTVPGEAVADFEIAKIDVETDSVLWPRRAVVTVALENTGRVRLRPTVDVDGVRAEGSPVLVSRSVEPYVAGVAVPWYGGPVRYNADARTDGGLVRTAATGRFYFPTIPAIILALLLVSWFVIRRWRRNRPSARVAELQDSVARLEQMITQSAITGHPTRTEPGGDRPRSVPEPSPPSRQDRVEPSLMEVPGLGAARRAALLERFGTFENIREATPEELMSVPGIGLATAERIRAVLDKASEDGNHEAGTHG